MTAPQVRVDYAELRNIAGRLGQQAQVAQVTLQSLQRDVNVLQDGDWIGKGATAFYQEMRGQVLPTLRRLAAALEAAQRTTAQIQQIMAQAEAEAARWLRGEGEGRSAALGAGLAFGPSAGTGVAFGGSGVAGASASGPLAGVAASPIRSALPESVAGAVERMVAQDNAAVDRVLAEFSPEVRDLIKRSQTVRAQIFELEKEGWTIRAGREGEGSFTDPDKKLIVIERPGSDPDTASLLAHEVGHAFDKTPWVPSKPYMTREEYVEEKTAFMLRDEGRAQFNAIQARAEVLASGGPDLGIPGKQDAAFLAAYNDFAAGRRTYAETIDTMAALMATEKPSRPYPTYRDMYRAQFEYIVDVDHDDPPIPTRRR